MNNYKVCAIIVAAGQSERMGCDKILLPIAGKPCIGYTMRALQLASTVTDIVIVTRRDLLPTVEKLISEYGISKFHAFADGGSCRQQSVVNGIMKAPAQTDFFCIHDGARPFVTPEEIDSVNRAAFRTGAAFCGTRVKDTIKQIDSDGIVVSTPRRADLVAAATPQTFDANLYRDCVGRFSARLASFTDDAGLFEAAGMKVSFIECGYTNIKLTTPEDIAAAEQIRTLVGIK